MRKENIYVLLNTEHTILTSKRNNVDCQTCTVKYRGKYVLFHLRVKLLHIVFSDFIFVEIDGAVLL